jgi:ammonium transporter, Amt family
VFGVLAIEKVLDDPVGALSAHGLAGIWGTVSCGIFTSPRYAELNAVGDGGLWYQVTRDNVPGGTFEQLGAQVLGIGASFAFAFAASLVVFGLIKATIGLRVSAEQEEAGLDIVEHGMYGYPEQFIPPSSDGGPAPVRAGTPASVTAMSATAPQPAASET